MTYDSMYGYYRDQQVLPTYGGFRSDIDLESHVRQRSLLFRDKLFLPPTLFQGRRLLEFGPDAGENSLVFAKWGANCTLVEPNLEAHPLIKSYFQRYHLLNQLIRLECLDIAEFAKRGEQPEKYDVIDAEGFIYTVRPESLWIDLFSRLLNNDGFVILFYIEAFGSFLELILKVIHATVRRMTSMGASKTAQTLFAKKWNSIPHKRSIESWIMDVLENPFVRLRYFFEPRSLCQQMREGGLDLYSSWPPYKDGMNVYWFKKVLTVDRQMQLQSDFIARSRLSHMFGRKHFLFRLPPNLDETLWHLLTLTDDLIDRFDKGKAALCVEYLSNLVTVLSSDAIMATEQDIAETLQTIRSVQRILDLLGCGEADRLITFCNNDQAFIQSWGTPSHFAVFRKESSS